MLKNYFLLYKYLKLTPREISSILEKSKSSIADDFAEFFSELNSGVKFKYHTLEEIRNKLNNKKQFQRDYEVFEASLIQSGVKWLAKDSQLYSERLLNIDSPPNLLFYKGNIERFERQRSVAIVGSRNASQYGLRVAYDLGRFLAEQNINVISGLALGIDGAAHRGALKGGGTTTAVMATGVNAVYPKSHESLYKEILLNDGMIISEKPLVERAYRYDFPHRNRLISALADVVVIIEASLKSGSLITARYAIDQGKPVFALPGNIYAETSKGTNMLLFDGATPLVDFSHILENMMLSTIKPINTEPKVINTLSDKSKKVFRLIKKFNIIEINEICRQLNMDITEVNIIV